MVTEMVTEGWLLPVSHRLCRALGCTVGAGGSRSDGLTVQLQKLRTTGLSRVKFSSHSDQENQALRLGTSLTDQGQPDQGRSISLGFRLKPCGLRSPPDHSLVVLALVLCDVKLCVQLVQQSVRALLAQRVIHVRLPRHDVEEVTGDLQEESLLGQGSHRQPPAGFQQMGSCFFSWQSNSCGSNLGLKQASFTELLTDKNTGRPVPRATLQFNGAEHLEEPMLPSKVPEFTGSRQTCLQSPAEVFHRAAIRRLSDQRETVGALCGHHSWKEFDRELSTEGAGRQV